jgi:glutamyl-tRNA reductase
VVPVIRSFRERVERIRKKELEKAISRWKNITPKEKEASTTCTPAIVKKILHKPVTQLKDSKEEDMILFVEALKKLFSLDEK